MFFEAFSSLVLCFFLKRNPRKFYMSHCIIVIKIKNCMCGLCITYIYVFLSFLFFCPLFPHWFLFVSTLCSLLYSSFPLFFSLPTSFTPPLLSSFINPYIPVSCYPICPPLTTPTLLYLPIPLSLSLKRVLQ